MRAIGFATPAAMDWLAPEFRVAETYRFIPGRGRLGLGCAWEQHCQR